MAMRVIELAKIFALRDGLLKIHQDSVCLFALLTNMEISQRGDVFNSVMDS